MPIFSFQKGIGYAMSILRLVFGKVNEDFLFALYPMPALRKASEGGRYAPCDFTLLSEVKGIITSPRKRPEVLRGSSPLLAPLEIGY